MKRHFTKFLIFIIIGAIINICIAWAISLNNKWWTSAVWSTGINWTSDNDDDIPNQWEFIRVQRFGAQGVSSWSSRANQVLQVHASIAFDDLPINESIGHWPADDPHPSDLPHWAWPRRWFTFSEPDDSFNIRQEFATGWPLLSLRSAHTINVSAVGSTSKWAGCLRTPNWSRDNFPGTFVPLYPIWPGFAINTLIYSAIVWILVIVPFAARRITRRKRGVCFKCGYDLRHADHIVCPECGTPNH